MRLLVLLILLACALLVLTRAFPQETTPAQLHEDLRSGKVDHLEKEPGENSYDDGGSVRWSTGLLAWHETRVPGPGWEADLPRQTRVTPVSDLHGEHSWWQNRHPAQMAWGAVIVLWPIMLIVMAGRSEPRYASRWTWFWMFTIGLSGVLLHLLLEPRPLWTRGSGDLGAPERRLHGVTGLLAAALLGLATGGVVLGLHAIVR